MCMIKRWNRRWGYNEDTDGEQEYGMYTENCCHANQWLHFITFKDAAAVQGVLQNTC
jgi:hypothetical protein